MMLSSIVQKSSRKREYCLETQDLSLPFITGHMSDTDITFPCVVPSDLLSPSKSSICLVLQVMYGLLGKVRRLLAERGKTENTYEAPLVLIKSGLVVNK